MTSDGGRCSEAAFVRVTAVAQIFCARCMPLLQRGPVGLDGVGVSEHQVGLR